jgi:hypothetical protein
VKTAKSRPITPGADGQAKVERVKVPKENAGTRPAPPPAADPLADPPGEIVQGRGDPLPGESPPAKYEKHERGMVRRFLDRVEEARPFKG